MDPDTNQIDMNKALAERFATLPKVVQDAITSADVQKHLRNLAEGHKLHVDQWQVLENNVMLTLLGFQPVAELTQHLQKDLEVTEEVAAELATNISTIVFSPIRSEMEQHLSHPTAVQAAVSDVEAIRAQALQGAAAENTPAPASETVATAPDTAPPAPGVAVVPATPPPPPPQEKAVRAQIAGTYTASKSHERKSIEGDPYREQIS